MLDAMIAGQRDPRVLADLAHGRMRVKLPQLRQALTGYFDDHHGFLCAAMLCRIDALILLLGQAALFRRLGLPRRVGLPRRPGQVGHASR
jgi:hypothetical protein